MERPIPPKSCAACSASGGTRKSAKQTAPQDAACVRPPDHPIVSVAALLSLARWAHGRRQAIRGQQSCDATPIDRLPPAPERPHTPSPPEPPLGGVAGPDSSGGDDHPQPNGGPGTATPSGRAGGVG